MHDSPCRRGRTCTPSRGSSQTSVCTRNNKKNRVRNSLPAMGRGSQVLRTLKISIFWGASCRPGRGSLLEGHSTDSCGHLVFHFPIKNEIPPVFTTSLGRQLMFPLEKQGERTSFLPSACGKCTRTAADPVCFSPRTVWRFPHLLKYFRPQIVDFQVWNLGHCISIAPFPRGLKFLDTWSVFPGRRDVHFSRSVGSQKNIDFGRNMSFWRTPI